jgi:hypothetical protein
MRRVRTHGAVTSLDGLRDSSLVFDPLQSRTLRTTIDGEKRNLVRTCRSAKSIEEVRCLLVGYVFGIGDYEPIATAPRVQHFGKRVVVDDLDPSVDRCRGAGVPQADGLPERIAGINHRGRRFDRQHGVGADRQRGWRGGILVGQRESGRARAGRGRDGVGCRVSEYSRYSVGRRADAGGTVGADHRRVAGECRRGAGGGTREGYNSPCNRLTVCARDRHRQRTRN